MTSMQTAAQPQSWEEAGSSQNPLKLPPAFHAFHETTSRGRTQPFLKRFAKTQVR